MEMLRSVFIGRALLAARGRYFSNPFPHSGLKTCDTDGTISIQRPMRRPFERPLAPCGNWAMYKVKGWLDLRANCTLPHVLYTSTSKRLAPTRCSRYHPNNTQSSLNALACLHPDNAWTAGIFSNGRNSLNFSDCHSWKATETLVIAQAWQGMSCIELQLAFEST